MEFAKKAANVFKIRMAADLLFTCSVVINVVNTKCTFENWASLHLRYLKGLNQPYSLATAHYDNLIKELFSG
jgi:hypothetical protein